MRTFRFAVLTFALLTSATSMSPVAAQSGPHSVLAAETESGISGAARPYEACAPHIAGRGALTPEGAIWRILRPIPMAT